MQHRSCIHPQGWPQRTDEDGVLVEDNREESGDEALPRIRRTKALSLPFLGHLSIGLVQAVIQRQFYSDRCDCPVVGMSMKCYVADGTLMVVGPRNPSMS